MSKVLAVMIAGLFAAGAYAQNPPGTSQEQSPTVDSKSQNRAEMKKDARPAGMVKAPMADANNSQEISGMNNDKASAAGEKRAKTRDARRPGHAKTTQGGTPK